MAKNRVIHARIEDKDHDKLTEKCNSMGCTYSDYLNNLVADSLKDVPEVDDELSIIGHEPLTKKRPEPKFTLVDKPKAEVRITPEPFVTIRDEYGNKWINGKLQ